MEIRKFKFEGTTARKWEYNFIGKKWNLRVANNQFGLWHNYKDMLHPIKEFKNWRKQRAYK